MVNCERRVFISGGLAFAAWGLRGAITSEPSRLRIGILSDIHVTPDYNGPFFEKALRYFDACKVDGVLIAGDLTQSGPRAEIETVAKIWFKVFPNDCRSDGTHIERLFLLGNHDADGIRFRKDLVDKLPPEAEMQANWFCCNRAKFWEEYFHESYEPIFYKELKGYKFILKNWVSSGWGDKDLMESFFAQHAAELKGDKPFFYAQHPHPHGTCCQSWTEGGSPWADASDDGLSTRVLSGYPNCIAFSGHSHVTLTDEHSIWQGAFTSVGCGNLSGYAFTFPGRENGHFGDEPGIKTPLPLQMPPIRFTEARQGMVMDVFDDRIVLERRDFLHDCPLGPDWVIPLPAPGKRPYDFKTRSKSLTAPEFAAEARVTVKTEKGRDRLGTERDQVIVSFPTIGGGPHHLRAHDFAVRMELRTGDLTRTVVEKFVYSPGMLLPEQHDRAPATCAFAKSEVPLKREVRFVVTPRDCWGNAGAPIASEWRKFCDF